MAALDLVRLDADGYVVVRSVTDAADIARLCEAFDDAGERRDGTQHVSVDADTPWGDAWCAVARHRRLHAVPRQWAQPDARHRDEVVIEAPAGSLLVLNGHLWHSGTRNDSTGPRRAAQLIARRASA